MNLEFSSISVIKKYSELICPNDGLIFCWSSYDKPYFPILKNNLGFNSSVVT